METAPKVGPVGLRVAENLKSLREEARHLTVRELSRRLGDLGRPVLASGITKMEQALRRVDADDLVALALALDVTPNRLLLDGTGARDATLGLAPEAEASSATAWAWATGEHPLSDPWATSDAVNLSRFSRFTPENRPHHPADDIRDEEMTKYAPELAAVNSAVRDARDAGLTTDQIVAYVKLLESFKAIADYAANAKERGGRGGKR